MNSAIRDDRLTSGVLSWVAGFVDTAGFLKLNGLFTAHVTGNLVVAGAELAGAGGDAVWVRLAVIPVFIAAVVLTSTIVRTRSVRLSNLLGVEMVALLIFAGMGVVFVPNIHHKVNTMTMFAVGSAGVFAMGIRNALMREMLGSLASTTVMTGNLTQFAIDATRLTLLHDYDRDGTSPRQEQEIRQHATKFGSALLGFVLGAACGAFFMPLIGFQAIGLPALAIALLALDIRRKESALDSA
jgi:uncharacterized membrane protein YoaK (UPF0700 family)